MNNSLKALIKATGCNLWVGVDISDNFYCYLYDCYIKDGSVLRDKYGKGHTIEEAVDDFINVVRHETLIVHPGSDSRKEISVLSL